MFQPLLALGDHQAMEAVYVDIREHRVDVGKLMEGDPRAHFSFLQSFADQVVGAEVDCVDADDIVGENISVLLPEVF